MPSVAQRWPSGQVLEVDLHGHELLGLSEAHQSTERLPANLTVAGGVGWGAQIRHHGLDDVFGMGGTGWMHDWNAPRQNGDETSVELIQPPPVVSSRLYRVGDYRACRFGMVQRHDGTWQHAAV